MQKRICSLCLHGKLRMKSVLYESGSAHHYKSKRPSQARLEKLMKKKAEKKEKKKKM